MNAAVSLEELVCSTIAKACRRPRESVSLATQLLDLQLDSLTFVSIIASVETVYDRQVSAEDFVSLWAATDIRALIGQLEAAISPP